MLYVKYLIRDYDEQSLEVKCDLYLAIKSGYEQGYLKNYQVQGILLYSQGWRLEQIAHMIHISVEETKQYLCAAFQYIETAIGYYDRSLIYAYKGQMKAEWLLKSQVVALEEWSDEDE